MSKPIKMYTITPAVFMALQFTPDCSETNNGLRALCCEAIGPNKDLEIDQPKGTVSIGGQILLSGDFIVRSAAGKVTIKSEKDFMEKYTEFERKLQMIIESTNPEGMESELLEPADPPKPVA